MPELTRRTLLPFLDFSHGGRSALTCRMRCGDACFHDVPNESANDYIGDVLQTAISRRRLMQAAVVVGAAGAVATAFPRSAVAGPPQVKNAAPGLKFPAISPSTADAVVIPEGYAQQIVIRWGDPLFADAPSFNPLGQTAAAQQRQFGYNNDYLGFFELDAKTQLMMVNHEYTDEYIMFPGYDSANPTKEQVEIAWAAHGLSVLAVSTSKSDGSLTPIVGHQLNRRFHAGTPFELSGPAAGSSYVKTSADPAGKTVLGTFNNCSGGLTPWGTWLTGEENINQYFANAATVSDPVVAARLKRYGISGMASERKWERFDPRWDIAQEPNEVNRHGYIVEIDPRDPSSTAKKRTALGRFKHEAAGATITADGRAAVYMGDDERFDYFYKFVSSAKADLAGGAAANANLLDDGTLYVARFTGDSPGEIDGSGKLPADGAFDGSGEWIPLVTGTTSHVPGMSAEEVYVFTRLAADKVGATKMDRPEDAEVHPLTGRVYVALTNNSNRGKPGTAPADEANPRNANKHGHVLELTETANDAGATTFGWSLFLVCGDPKDPSTYFAGFDKTQVSPISCPDNVTFDKYGNLWISTDGNQLGSHDGLYGVATEGPYRGQVKQFLSVPIGAETCGPWVTDDRALVCVQHPGETDGATFESPSSHWPDGGDSIPRPSVVSVWRTGHPGKIGH